MLHIPLKKGCFMIRSAKTPETNITKEEEHKRLKELRQDKERMVLTADKTVAMVVMDRKEYMEKCKAYWLDWLTGLLQQTPTNKLKARLIKTLKRIKRDTNMEEGIIRLCTLLVVLPPSSMDYQKSIKLVSPIGQLCLAGVLLPIV